MPSKQRVLVTGANGNLGQKLVAALLDSDWCESIIGLDRDFSTRRLPDDTRIATLEGDLTDRAGAWRDALAYTDAVVHLAAQNPYPDASWADCSASIDMTLNVIAAAAAHDVKRMVFASSNHVMGAYKETPIALQSGTLTTALEPRPGTRWMSGETVHDSPAYAVAKLVGERALASKADAHGLTAVSLRIGWCQPGENHPQTISAAGTPLAPGEPESAAQAHDLRWFRQMWLSNADFTGAVLAALRADASRWPAPAIVVNAMSANANMPWDIEPTRTLIGYKPQDDVWRSLGLDPPA